MNETKTTAMEALQSINAVEGFDPSALAVEYSDLNDGETRKRLPVMAQIGWFRLKYPEGRIAISVTPGKDCFVATARVYHHYTDPVDQFLSEATASRGYLPEKPTVSPREWAQTAAVGIALRNAGFGLQFGAAGDSFDSPAVDELGGKGTPPEHSEAGPAGRGRATEWLSLSAQQTGEIAECARTRTGDPEEIREPHAEPSAPPAPQSNETPLEKAMKMPCPISKYSGKTLGEVVQIDPHALVWVANKFTGNAELSAAARLICEQAVSQEQR